ncbi:hypothetical protein V8C86DRAFT_2656944, partial [Haematococcus lacustris]
MFSNSKLFAASAAAITALAPLCQACTRLRSHNSSTRAPQDFWQQLVQPCLQCSRSLPGLRQGLLPCGYVRVTAVNGWAALGQVAGHQGQCCRAAVACMLPGHEQGVQQPFSTKQHQGK